MAGIRFVAAKGRLKHVVETRPFLHIHGAKQLHPVTIVVRLVFGALPDSFRQDAVNVGGEVPIVPEDARLRVIADSGRRVSLVAVLAWRNVVGAQGALLPTLFCTTGLEHEKLARKKK